MTNFTHNGQRYSIRFGYAERVRSNREETKRLGNKGIAYRWGNKILDHIKGKFIRTFCTIAVKEDEGWRALAGDYVIRVPEDQFIKSYGRMRALVRTLDQLKDEALADAAWKAYVDQSHKDSPIPEL